LITRYTGSMTETQTITTAPNGTTVTTHPHPTWDVTSYRAKGALTSKVIAIHPDRKLARHQEKVTDALLESTIAVMTGGPTITPNHDFTAALFASVDAIAANKARQAVTA
jgi:hypothetical protein